MQLLLIQGDMAVGFMSGGLTAIPWRGEKRSKSLRLLYRKTKLIDVIEITKYKHDKEGISGNYLNSETIFFILNIPAFLLT